jgi:RNA-dependent RNA polymerase
MQISKRLGLQTVPSAFQIRYSGFKGVLAIDNRLEEVKGNLHLRESMHKFDSRNGDLEIVQYSQPRKQLLLL